MGNEFEKTADNILSGEKGAIPTSIKQLAISLDNYFTQREKVEQERHDELINMIIGNKTQTDASCNKCRGEMSEKFKVIDNRFEKLKYVTFFSENPKLGIALLLAGVILIGSGFDNIITKIFQLL